MGNGSGEGDLPNDKQTSSRNGWLVEILLPLSYNDGSPVSDEALGDIRRELGA